MTTIFGQGTGFLPGINGLALPDQGYLLLPPFATLNAELWLGCMLFTRRLFVNIMNMSGLVYLD